jgi:RNA polymerase sigma factor (sigma-70 family)
MLVTLKMKQLFDRDKAVSLSTCQLLVECGRNLHDGALWGAFYSRYKCTITCYLWHAYRLRGGLHEDFLWFADDWVQEVFTKLLQNSGRVVRSFRGSTLPSLNSFLRSIAASIVKDHMRSRIAFRRRGQSISLEDVDDKSQTFASDTESRITALLEFIDIERTLHEDAESKNPERDMLIFKLHFVEGRSASEIASIQSLNLTTSGVEKVINRIRNRIYPQRKS